ncbi:hypothetical protein VB715_15945 [Crocosphaera sp. UHCC 0190]|uniref:hypothetical protein n=1 Tax=Crocosphaera sp. UHCC 0190 TaxID=3110246 RepID=UPI002B1F418C|nr:hypothetical protein [Crocosphaera sp. UHCC 0190]MEA5511265.1 hypothetical protein [Crocosphaera sp. UHCC 0190]
MRFFLSDLPGLSSSNMVNNCEHYLLCYSCFSFKILAYIFIIISIVICLYKGFVTQPIRLIIKPEDLLLKAKHGTTTQSKKAIIENIWKNSVKDAMRLLEMRSKALKQAVLLLMISMIFAGLDIIIHFVFYEYK